jgi:hypothetical protein
LIPVSSPVYLRIPSQSPTTGIFTTMRGLLTAGLLLAPIAAAFVVPATPAPTLEQDVEPEALGGEIEWKKPKAFFGESQGAGDATRTQVLTSKRDPIYCDRCRGSRPLWIT